MEEAAEQPLALKFDYSAVLTNDFAYFALPVKLTSHFIIMHINLGKKKKSKKCSHSNSIDMVRSVHGQYVLVERAAETVCCHYATLDMSYLK